MLAGVLTVSSPVGLLPKSDSFSFTGAGSCNASINGGPMVNHPVTVSANGSGTFSCELTEVTGTGAITATDVHKTIHFSFTALGSAISAVRFTGAAGGQALGAANFLGSPEPQLLQQCAQGTATSALFQVQAQTVGGPISG